MKVNVLMFYCYNTFPLWAEWLTPANMLYVCVCPKSGVCNSVVVFFDCIWFLFFVYYWVHTLARYNSHSNCITFCIWCLQLGFQHRLQNGKLLKLKFVQCFFSSLLWLWELDTTHFHWNVLLPYCIHSNNQFEASVK